MFTARGAKRTQGWTGLDVLTRRGKKGGGSEDEMNGRRARCCNCDRSGWATRVRQGRRDRADRDMGMMVLGLRHDEGERRGVDMWDVGWRRNNSMTTHDLG